MYQPPNDIINVIVILVFMDIVAFLRRSGVRTSGGTAARGSGRGFLLIKVIVSDGWPI